MDILIFISITVGISYFLLKRTMNSHLDSVFLDFNLLYGRFSEHPYVQGKVIPYLKKNGFSGKKFNEIKLKIKKEHEQSSKLYSNRKPLTEGELESQTWNTILYDLTQQAINKYGTDRALSFTIVNSGSNSSIIWSNLLKDFIPNRKGEEEFNFFLKLHEGEEKGKFTLQSEEQLYIIGNTAHQKREGKDYKIFVIYFYVEPLERKAEDVTSYDGKYKVNRYSSEIGILIEIPYKFIDYNRHIWWRKQPQKMIDLFEKFSLKDKSFGKDNWNITPAGQPLNIGEEFNIGNDFISVRIR